MSSILVLTPLPLELQSLRDALTSQALFRLAVGGHGKVGFALTTQAEILALKPTLVICAGAAGALAPHLKIGDVVVADTTVEHDFHLRFVQRPPPEFNGHLATLEILKKTAEALPFTTHFGRIASGDEDVTTPKRAQEIAAATSALAVAWEGAGGARACLHHKVPFVEIRVITDSADHKAAQDFMANLKSGMGNVAQLIATLLP